MRKLPYLRVFISYTNKYCNEKTVQSRVVLFFETNAHKVIVRILKKLRAETSTVQGAWIIFHALSHVERVEYFEYLGAVNIIALGMDAVRAHGRDEGISTIVFTTIAFWLSRARVLPLPIPQYDNHEILLRIVLTLERFPESSMILRTCCEALDAFSSDFEELRNPHLSASFVSSGAYEIFVAAIQQLPEDRSIINAGAKGLVAISGDYFSDQTRHRNTESCVALAACLPFHFANKEISFTVVSSINRIMRCSPESGIKFVCPGRGLSLIKPVLFRSI